jgi:Protein of unknown function DUF262
LDWDYRFDFCNSIRNNEKIGIKQIFSGFACSMLRKTLFLYKNYPIMTKQQQKVAEQIAAEKQILYLQKIADYRMRDYTIEELVDLYKIGRISDTNILFISPEHRQFLWDENRQSLFIESLLIGLPVAPIFAVEAKGSRLAVLDGMQRLTTLERFLDNQLILNHLSQLTLLNGFQFQDLPLSRQRRFKTIEIRLVALTEKADSSVRQEILKRMRTFAL